MSLRNAKAPISAIHFVAGSPTGCPQARRSTRIKSRCGSGSGAARLTGPESSSRTNKSSTARTKSSSWIHDTYCRPPATDPPSPSRTIRSSTSKTPPRSGLITIAARSWTFRVSGTSAVSWVASQVCAIRTLYSQ